MILALQPVILAPGFLDELDFWAGTAGIVLFATFEVIIFAWVFGMGKGWKEINEGADIKVPKVFYYILKYVTPVYLIGLLVGWVGQQGKNIVTLVGIPPEQIPWKWAARGLMLLIIVILVILVRFAVRLRSEEAQNA